MQDECQRVSRQLAALAALRTKGITQEISSYRKVILPAECNIFVDVLKTVTSQVVLYSLYHITACIHKIT